MIRRTLALCAISLAAAAPAAAQSFPTADPVLQRIWRLGMDSSQAYALSQSLLDSVGPRLTGSPEMKAGQEWLLARYAAWGIPARNERYGTWRGWQRGITHVDLVSPRVRSLEAMMLAWSPGTRGPVQGAALVLPNVATAAEFERWLPQVRGKFVLVSFAQPSCRAPDNWRRFEDSLSGSYERFLRERSASLEAWNRRVRASAAPADTTLALAARNLSRRLEQAGAAGVITNLWSGGWGVDRIFNARTQRVPTINLSCEDYGLVHRLAEHGQGPVLRVEAQAQDLGEVPVFNTIAEIRGSEKPDEYVMLSAHFDSWDGASGATDNGTGTVVMLEAMRILRQVYPNPKRTIVVGHWSGEEQGLIGSRAYAADHPEVVRGLQALFNQDNGTGRVVSLSAQGLVGASANYAGWISRLPHEISRHISLTFPGSPAGGGSDYASFLCHGAPAFNLSALNWEYGMYTWHTNRDTFDKIVFDDLRNNATLTAMLAYLASEDPETTPRDRRVMPANARTGQQMQWPSCGTPPRSSAEWSR